VPALEERDPHRDHRRLLGVKLWGLFGADAVHVPYDRIRVEVRAIVKLHPTPQMEDPPGIIVRPRFPRLGQARDQLRQTGTLRQVPVDQGILHLVADKPIALPSLVWLTAGIGDIGGSHANA